MTKMHLFSVKITSSPTSNHTETILPSKVIICAFSTQYITDYDGKITTIVTYSLSSISSLTIIAIVFFFFARFWPCAHYRANQTHLINPCLRIYSGWRELQILVFSILLAWMYSFSSPLLTFSQLLISITLQASSLSGSSSYSPSSLTDCLLVTKSSLTSSSVQV